LNRRKVLVLVAFEVILKVKDGWKTVRKLAVIVLGVVMLSAVLSGIASAQQYPTVSYSTPFNASTGFMSSTGYLRYLAHEWTGEWLTL
jgi:hypothetical protein